MGTLGQYLQEARESLGINIRDASQQTRISLQYLKALESEDFARLPGEVFVKGFLKNYAKFLHLDESEVLRKYAETGQKKPAPSSAAAPVAVQQAAEAEPKARSERLPIEPFIWGAGIVIVLLILLFTALPRRHHQEKQQAVVQQVPTGTEIASAPVPTAQPEKLYLEVVALENTWLLIRTDSSPQKKAVLNKGESLIWSADERFLLSYGSAGALKLALNGVDLVVDEPRNAVVRDLTITAAGIASRKLQAENSRQVKPKRPASLSQQTSTQAPTSSPTSTRSQRRRAASTITTTTSTTTPAPRSTQTTAPAAAPVPGNPSLSGQTGSAQ